MDYIIYPPEDILDTTVDLPLSKSISARLLVMNKLTGAADVPETTVADCEDTRALRGALSCTEGTVDVGAAGTAMRFAAAYFAATPGTQVLLCGSERMHNRPIGILVEALRELGADIEYAGREGFPPLRICGRRLSGGHIAVDASVSSQYLSALAMIAPTLDSALTVTLNNVPASLPYLRMTVDMMKARGIDAELSGMTMHIAPGAYRPLPDFEVEPDWSAASYWYAVAALSAGWVTLPGLRADSAQGDSAMARYGERLGVITTFTTAAEADDDTPPGAALSASPEVFNRLDLDMSAVPDLVQTLAVAAPMLGVPFRFSGVHTLRDKETDRIAALCSEAAKLGLLFDTEGDDVLAWEGRRCPVFERPVIDTYGDHRMAMAFAPAALYVPGLVIRDVEVVDKSYPTFWSDMAKAGFTLADAGSADSDETRTPDDEEASES